MKQDHVRWLSAAVLSLAALASGSMEAGGRPGHTAWAVEPAQLPVRSLTTEVIRGLQEGDAMRLERAAEVNGYPSPAHILEAARAGKIEVYAEQREAIERIQASTKARAQSLGHAILAEEAALEASFRTGHIADADLARQVEAIGGKLAELRLTHLRANLLTAAILRPQQIEEYYQFRGYVVPSSGCGLPY